MQRIINGLDEIFDKTNIPKVLYHYTSLNGFKSIIENRFIWATDFRFLNDIDEVRHIFKDILPIISPSEYTDSSDKIPDRLFDNNIFKPILISSFSEINDNIAMWGRYSNDEGINIGIHSESILNSFLNEDQTQVLYVGKCIYDDKLKYDIVNRIYQKYLNEENGFTFFKELLLVAPFLKNSSFEHEKEWRIVAEYSPDSVENYGRPRFRISKNSIVPYGNISIFNNVNKRTLINSTNIIDIPEINISPRLSRTPNALNMIKYFLTSNKFICNNISFSKSSVA
jgi:hypothetical protein